MNNLKVGTRFTQVKEIEMFGFNYVGQEFEITKIEKGAVSFRGITTLSLRAGIDINEFFNYFELIEEVKEEYACACDYGACCEDDCSTCLDSECGDSYDHCEDCNCVISDFTNDALLEELENRLNKEDDGLDVYSVSLLLTELSSRAGVHLKEIHKLDNTRVYSLVVENN